MSTPRPTPSRSLTATPALATLAWPTDRGVVCLKEPAQVRRAEGRSTVSTSGRLGERRGFWTLRHSLLLVNSAFKEGRPREADSAARLRIREAKCRGGRRRCQLLPS